MTILNTLSSNQKHFIEDVVDSYTKSLHSFKTDPMHTAPVFGMFLQDAFYDDNYYVTPCKVKGKLNLIIKFISNNNYSLCERLQYDTNMTAYVQIKFIERLKFIKLLWDNGLIYFVGNLNSELSEFDFSSDDKEYCKRMCISASLSPLESDDYAIFLGKYKMAQIIPSEFLIDFCSNSFTTLEERQYKEQQQINIEALKRAKRANIIAISIAALSILASIICAYFIPVSINNKQHNELIEIIKTQYNGQINNEKP